MNYWCSYNQKWYNGSIDGLEYASCTAPSMVIFDRACNNIIWSALWALIMHQKIKSLVIQSLITVEDRMLCMYIPQEDIPSITIMHKLYTFNAQSAIKYRKMRGAKMQLERLGAYIRFYWPWYIHLWAMQISEEPKFPSNTYMSMKALEACSDRDLISAILKMCWAWA